MIKRKNAYTEVYTILQDLDEESNWKIAMQKGTGLNCKFCRIKDNAYFNWHNSKIIVYYNSV